MPKDYAATTDEQIAYIEKTLGPTEAAYVRDLRKTHRQRAGRITELGRLKQAAAGLPETGRNIAGDPIYTPAPRLPVTEEEHGARFAAGPSPEQRKQGLLRYQAGQEHLKGLEGLKDIGRRVGMGLGAGALAGIQTKSPIVGAIEGIGAAVFPPRTPGELGMQAVAGPFGQVTSRVARGLQRGGTARRMATGAVGGAAEAGLYATGEQAIDVVAGQREKLGTPSAALLLGGGAGTIGGALSGIGARQGTFIQVQDAYKQAGLDVPKTPKELQSWKRKSQQRIPETAVPGSTAKHEVARMQFEEKTTRRQIARAKREATRGYSDLVREKGQVGALKAVETAKLDQELSILVQRIEHTKLQQRKFLAGQKTTKFDIDAANKTYARRKVDFTVEERFANLAADQHLKTVAADSKAASGAIATIRSDLAAKMADTSRAATTKTQDKEMAMRLIDEWTIKKADADNLLVERAIDAVGAEQKRLAKMPRQAREQLDFERDTQLFGEMVADSEVNIQELRTGYAELKTRAADVTLKHKEKLHDIDIRMAKAKTYDSNVQAAFAVHLAETREKLAGVKYRDNPRIAQMLSGNQRDVLGTMSTSPAAIFGEYVETLSAADRKIVQDATFERMFSDVFVENKPWRDQHAKVEFLLGTEKANILTDILDGAAQAFQKSWVSRVTGRIIHHTPTLIAFHPSIVTHPAVAASGGALFVATTWNKLVGKALDNPKVGRELANWLKDGATVMGLRASHHLKDLFEETVVPVSPERAGSYFNLGQNAMRAEEERQRQAQQQPAPQAPAQ